jgi:hypothetical protein
MDTVLRKERRANNFDGSNVTTLADMLSMIQNRLARPDLVSMNIESYTKSRPGEAKNGALKRRPTAPANYCCRLRMVANLREIFGRPKSRK